MLHFSSIYRQYISSKYMNGASVRVARFLNTEALRTWQQDLIDRNQTTCNIGSLAVMQSYVVSWFEFKHENQRKPKLLLLEIL